MAEPDTMAAVRKELIWNIKKQLFTLSSNNIYEVAKNIATNNQPGEELNPADEESCMDFVISFLKSDALLEREDKGMGWLLDLNDLIHKLKNVDAADNSEASELNDVCIPIIPNHTQTTTIKHSTFQPHTHFNSTTMQSQTHSITQPNIKMGSAEGLRHMYEELGEKLRQYESIVTLPIPDPPHQGEPGLYDRPQMTPDQPVRLKDLPYLQRKDFKIHGGQVGDQSSDLSYNNISKQIDEGVKEGFTEAEVVRGVLRIIKPGAFKDMLVNKDSITVSELKGFLRSHLGEKASTEMFQELMCARQSDQEPPQQFLYRMIGLKQKLLFQTLHTSTDITYDPKTIQKVFLHTIYQGLGPKHADLRQRLRPLIANSQVTDEEILSQVMKITRDEYEHQRRLGQLPRQKTTQAHSTKVEKEGNHNKPQNAVADSINLQTIGQLSAQVEALSQMVASLMDLQSVNPRVSQPLTRSAYQQPRPPYEPPQNRSPQPQLRQPAAQTRGRMACCLRCNEQNSQECNHCFTCGEAGHRAIGCLKRVKLQGNGTRSLLRDTQRPASNSSPEQ